MNYYGDFNCNCDATINEVYNIKTRATVTIAKKGTKCTNIMHKVGYKTKGTYHIDSFLPSYTYQFDKDLKKVLNEA